MWENIIETIKVVKDLNGDISHVYPYLVRALKLLRESAEYNGPDDTQNAEFIQMKNYRVYISGNIMSIFNILYDANQKEAINILFMMAGMCQINDIQEPSSPLYQNYIRKLESFVFFAHSIIDVFETDKMPVQYLIDVFKLILIVRPNMILGQAALLFIKECAIQIKFCEDLLIPSIEYCLFIIQNYQALQTLSLKTLEEISEISPKLNPSEKAFYKIFEFIQSDLIYSLKLENCSNIGKTIGYFLINNSAKIQDFLALFCKFICEKLHFYALQETVPYKIQYILMIFANFFKSFIKSEYAKSEISAIFTKHVESFPLIFCEIAQKFSGSTQLIDLICLNCIGIIELSNISEENRNLIGQTMSKIWENNILQSNSLKVISMLIELLKNEELSQISDKICAHFLNNMMKISENQALSVVENLADFIKKVLNKCIDILLISKNTENLIAVFCNLIISVCEENACKKICGLFKEIIINTKNTNKFDQIIYNICYSAILGIPVANFTVTDLSKIIAAGMEINEKIAIDAIINGLSSDKFKNILPMNEKMLVIDYLKKNTKNTSKVKTAIKLLHNLTNGLAKLEDFIKLTDQNSSQSGIDQIVTIE